MTARSSPCPVVVNTAPEAGSATVDAGLTEIKVTFSKDMQDGSWSWSTVSKESFPKVDGKPKYLADKRTCVLPVPCGYLMKLALDGQRSVCKW